MTAQAAKPTKPAAVKIRRPKPGSKAEAILTLTTTTPATPPQIAGKLNTSIQNVHQVLDRYGIEHNALETFKNTRADIYAAAQLRILAAVDDDRLKSASVNNLAYALKEFNLAEKLERGQATSRIELDLSDRLRSALSRSGGGQAIEAEVVETKSTTDRVEGLLTNDSPNAEGE